MHAAIMGNRPPVRYLAPASVALLDAVAALRAQGLGAWATADAGPNVAVLTRAEDVPTLRDRLAERFPDLRLISAQAGPGAHLADRGRA